MVRQYNKTAKKPKTTLFILLSALAIAFLLASATSCGVSKTRYDWKERADGTYDVAITNIKKSDDSVTVPTEKDGKTVTSFLMGGKSGYFSPVVYVNGEKRGALYGLKSITLSEGILEVNINHLDRYPDLERIVLPSTIRLVQGLAPEGVEVVFSGNEHVEFDSGCFIDKATLAVTGAIQSFEIPDGVKAIGSNAFYRSPISEIKLPASLEKIGDSAFSACSGLTEVIIPDSVTDIGECAFADCNRLISITVGSGVKRIGYCTFMRCYALAEVANRSSFFIESGDALFSSYREVFVHSGDSRLQREGDFLFYPADDGPTLVGYTGSSTAIILPESFGGEGYALKSYVFYNRDDITDVNLGNGVTSIGEFAFSDCDSLSSVTIGSGVREIERSAFKDSALTSATFALTGGWMVHNGPSPFEMPQANLSSADTAAEMLLDWGGEGWWRK